MFAFPIPCSGNNDFFGDSKPGGINSVVEIILFHSQELEEHI